MLYLYNNIIKIRNILYKNIQLIRLVLLTCDLFMYIKT